MPDAEVPALDPGLRDLIAEVRELADPISEGGIRLSDMLRLTLGCADDGGPATGH